MTGIDTYLHEGVQEALLLANSLNRWRNGRLTTKPAAETAGYDTRRTQLGRRLQTVLTAGSPAASSVELNELLALGAAAPALVEEADGRWRMHLHSPHADPLTRTMVKTAAGLAAVVDDDRWSTIKRCAATRCEDFFHDSSRNGSRQYCSRTCANRMNAQASRDRRTAGR